MTFNSSVQGRLRLNLMSLCSKVAHAQVYYFPRHAGDMKAINTDRSMALDIKCDGAAGQIYDLLLVSESTK